MRISANEDDAGFAAWKRVPEDRRRDIRIFLDGAEQRRVVTADADQGIVVRLKEDAAGQIFVLNDEIAQETLTGNVRIEMPGT